MYSLNTISKLNDRAAARPATPQVRNCSFTGTSTRGIVLHSAKRQSTALLTPFKAKTFLAGWKGTNSVEKRNELVETYFNSAPGKGLSVKNRNGLDKKEI